MTIRDQAIRIMAVCASNNQWFWSTWSAGEQLGASMAAKRLAIDAYWAASSDDIEWQERYAEAECLLREGWCPT